ncbi:MAG TPA: VOC family protein [Bryobacteraceae bacterium]|nr:VOC family protein [Bryobacteraceae bacterium]
MEQMIAKLLQDFEQGKMNRRQLIQSLAVTATAAAAVTVTEPAQAAGTELKAVGFNHVSYSVADYAKSRDFYTSLFSGMKVTRDDGKQCRLEFGNTILIVRTRPPTGRVDHIAYTLSNWDKDKDAIEAEVKRRGLTITNGSAKTSIQVKDPDGMGVQFGGLEQ